MLTIGVDNWCWPLRRCRRHESGPTREISRVSPSQQGPRRCGSVSGQGSAQAGSRMQPARLHGSGSKGAHHAASGRRTANVRIDVRIGVHGVVHLPVLELGRPGSRRSDGHLRWSPADMVKNGLSQASPGQAPSPAMRRGPPTRRGASGMERRAPAKGTVPFRRVIVITVGVRRSAFEAPQGRC